jgi:F-type H+-transporting ATPase subunit delta
MPGRTTAGKRYAEAIAAIARGDNSWERWRQDLAVIGQALQDAELRLTLESPRVSAERKNQVLDQVLGGRVAPATQNLLKVMGRRARLGLLPDVAMWFDELADRALGYTVTTAAPLTDAQRQELQQRLGTDGGKAVLTERTDPALLGGLVVQHEDIIRDYSIRTRLQSLRDRLN